MGSERASGADLLSVLRSPVVWILAACVLVIAGIALLFDLQEPDTDWRRQRWDGTRPDTRQVEASRAAAAARAESWEAALAAAEPARDAVVRLGDLLRYWRADNEELVALIGRVESGFQVRVGAGGVRDAAGVTALLGAGFHENARAVLFRALLLVKRVRDKTGNQREVVNLRAARAIRAVAPLLDPSMRVRWAVRLQQEVREARAAPEDVGRTSLDAASAALVELRAGGPGDGVDASPPAGVDPLAQG